MNMNPITSQSEKDRENEDETELEGKKKTKPGLQDLIKDDSRLRGPSSPLSISIKDGKQKRPAEVFRTDFITAMKVPDSQTLPTGNIYTLSDTWRQEWEKGVQVTVNADAIPSVSLQKKDESSTPTKRYTAFSLPRSRITQNNPEFAHSNEKHGACTYDLDDVDVRWLGMAKTKTIKKGKIDESAMEKAMTYFERKCFENMAHAVATKKGLSIEYDETTICEVCLSPDTEENNEILFCDACNMCAHQACYGVTEIPTGTWLCRPCSRGILSPPCVICPNKGGAMKRLKGSYDWIHVICAWWVPEVKIEDIDNVERITVDKIPASRKHLVCHLCREKMGACIQCSVKRCVTAYHVTCGVKMGLELKTVMLQDKDDVQHISYCKRHCVPQPLDQHKLARPGENVENQRLQELQKLQESFYKLVNVNKSTRDLRLNREVTKLLFAYWVLKRKGNENRPLIPLTTEQQEKLSGKQGIFLIQEQINVEMERYALLRQDLERLRNLCYLIIRRERVKREVHRSSQDVFFKQNEALTSEPLKLSPEDISTISSDERTRFTKFPFYAPDGPPYADHVRDEESSKQESDDPFIGKGSLSIGERGESSNVRNGSEVSDSDIIKITNGNRSKKSISLNASRQVANILQRPRESDVEITIESADDNAVKKDENQLESFSLIVDDLKNSNIDLPEKENGVIDDSASRLKLLDVPTINERISECNDAKTNLSKGADFVADANASSGANTEATITSNTGTSYTRTSKEELVADHGSEKLTDRSANASKSLNHTIHRASNSVGTTLDDDKEMKTLLHVEPRISNGATQISIVTSSSRRKLVVSSVNHCEKVNDATQNSVNPHVNGARDDIRTPSSGPSVASTSFPDSFRTCLQKSPRKRSKPKANNCFVVINRVLRSSPRLRRTEHDSDAITKDVTRRLYADDVVPEKDAKIEGCEMGIAGSIEEIHPDSSGEQRKEKCSDSELNLTKRDRKSRKNRYSELPERLTRRTTRLSVLCKETNGENTENTSSNPITASRDKAEKEMLNMDKIEIDSDAQNSSSASERNDNVGLESDCLSPTDELLEERNIFDLLKNEQIIQRLKLNSSSDDSDLSLKSNEMNDAKPSERGINFRDETQPRNDEPQHSPDLPQPDEKPPFGASLHIESNGFVKDGDGFDLKTTECKSVIDISKDELVSNERSISNKNASVIPNNEEQVSTSEANSDIFQDKETLSGKENCFITTEQHAKRDAVAPSDCTGNAAHEIDVLNGRDNVTNHRSNSNSQNPVVLLREISPEERNSTCNGSEKEEPSFRHLKIRTRKTSEMALDGVFPSTVIDELIACPQRLTRRRAHYMMTGDSEEDSPSKKPFISHNHRSSHSREENGENSSLQCFSEPFLVDELIACPQRLTRRRARSLATEKLTDGEVQFEDNLKKRRNSNLHEKNSSKKHRRRSLWDTDSDSLDNIVACPQRLTRARIRSLGLGVSDEEQSVPR